MLAAATDLSIAISSKRTVCILDPALAISSHGIALIERLGSIMQLWVAREHWHILDNTDYYLKINRESENNQLTDWLDPEALANWEALRTVSDPAALNLFWVGDGPGESMLPADTDACIVFKYERYANLFDEYFSHNQLLMPAFRDALALAAVLPQAFILTNFTAEDGLPPICHALSSVGINPITVGDQWQNLEREWLRQQIVKAGGASLFWQGLNLAVVHVSFVRDYFNVGGGDQDLRFIDSEVLSTREKWHESKLWHRTKAYWYPL